MNKIMRRLCVYIFTALATFTIGLGCSLYLETNDDGVFVSQIRPILDNHDCSTKEERRIVSGMAGQGFSDDGFPASFSNHDYSDGTYIHQESINYSSPERANSELQKRIKLASEVVRREPVVDKDGKKIGERVVTSGAGLLWTTGREFVIQRRRSVQDILEALDGKR